MKRISLILLFSVCLCFANSFEESLMAEPSEMDLVYRLREQMLSALQAKDTTGILTLTEMLAEKKTDGILPISLLEIEVVYLKAKMYNSLTEYLVKYYRNLPDTLEKINEAPSRDVLSAFVAKQIRKTDTSRSVFYVFENMVKNSRLSDAEKKKLELFVFLEDAYKNDETRNHVQWLARTYLNDYPSDPDSAWIEKCIHAPLKRFDIKKYALERGAKNKEALIRSKYYTGGLGFDVFLFSGGFENSYDFGTSAHVEPNSPAFDVEFYLQLSRFVVLFEFVDLFVYMQGALGAGFGVVAFDSRYFKVRPYVEFGTMALRSYIELYKDGEEVEYSEISDGYTFVTAVKFELKFATTYFGYSIQKLTSFCVVGKIGMAYTEIDNEFSNGDGFSTFFGLGLGVYFW